MAYEGETVRIIARAFDFDGDPIVPAEVTSAIVNLYDGSGNFVFLDASLSYEPVGAETTDPYWYFDWQNVVVGSWIAQCIFTGVSYVVFEYVTVKIKARKIIPTGQPVPQ